MQHLGVSDHTEHPKRPVIVPDLKKLSAGFEALNVIFFSAFHSLRRTSGASPGGLQRLKESSPHSLNLIIHTHTNSLLFNFGVCVLGFHSILMACGCRSAPSTINQGLLDNPVPSLSPLSLLSALCRFMAPSGTEAPQVNTQPSIHTPTPA